MKKPKNPCVRECPVRKEMGYLCKQNCEKLKAYEAEYAEYYEKRKVILQVQTDLIGLRDDAVTKIVKERRNGYYAGKRHRDNS